MMHQRISKINLTNLSRLTVLAFAHAQTNVYYLSFVCLLTETKLH